ncbi:MAG: methyltransferase domain-containing protein [Planctomycetota bacterium]|nr:MAG: methyltransferase domain-containing protein [Planctomycetota bacterium]
MAKFPQRGPGGQPPSRRRRADAERPIPSPQSTTAWEAQAQWYDQRQGEAGDDFHSQLVLPAVLRQLAVQPGQTVLDCCCGNGVLGRHLASHEIRSIGIDAAPSLIEAARERAGALEEHRLGDAHRMLADQLVAPASCDAAALVLALQDLDPLDKVLRGCAHVVRPGGRLVIVLTHPCFHLPKAHHWGWDEEAGMMYRRLDGYALPRRIPIKTFPGRSSSASSSSYHRPLAMYLNALGAAGWGVIGSEELCSHRRGSRGRKSAAEDAAHREFPVFLLLTAQRLEPALPARQG